MGSLTLFTQCYNAYMTSTIALIIIVAIWTFAAMVLHELSHGLVAYWLGDDTAKRAGRLTLNPFAHVDPVMTFILPMALAIMNVVFKISVPIMGGAKPVPIDPRNMRGGEAGAAATAAAGPLMNLLLAFICYIILSAFKAAPWWLNSFFYVGVLINLSLFAFNILPIVPLDGSRILHAIAPDGVRRGMDAIEGRLGLMNTYLILLIASPLVYAATDWIMAGVLVGFGAIAGAFGL